MTKPADETVPEKTTPPASHPANQSKKPVVHDDDPGGHPCTDQSGAPGHYIPNSDSTGWVCEITGDAPQVKSTPKPKPPVHDDDPGGKPCTDQSGAPGHYIPNSDSTGWVCEITGDAPR